MAKPLFVFLFCIEILSVLSCDAQSWQWGRNSTHSGGNGPIFGGFGSEGVSVKTDGWNRIYAAAYQWGDSMRLGTYTLYNPNYFAGQPNSVHSVQTVIAKYDNDGSVLWAKTSTNGESEPFNIVVDAGGYLYVYGTYTTDSIAFDGNYITNANYNSAMSWVNNCYFITKYDPDGHVVWVKSGLTISTNSNDLLSKGGIATDKDGNVYITGSFSDAVVHIGGYTLTNTGASDIFLVKYSPDGNVIWAKSFAGDDADYSYGISISDDDKIYITGAFGSSIIHFGSTALTYSSYHATSGGTFTNTFLAAFDLSGNAIWAKSSYGAAFASSVCSDRDNNIYIGGGVVDTVVAFGAFSFHNSLLSKAAFLTKYDNIGNVLWSKMLARVTPTMYRNTLYSISIDTSNNVWISGKFGNLTGSIKLDDTTVLYPPSNSTDPTFFVEYTSGGILVHSEALPTGGDDVACLAADNVGNIYMLGDMNTIDPFIIGGDTLYLGGQQENMFLAKYGTNYMVGIQDQNPMLPVIKIFPNPAFNEITIETSITINTITVTNFLGQSLITKKSSSSLETVNTSILPPGIYVMRVNDLYMQKFVKE